MPQKTPQDLFRFSDEASNLLEKRRGKSADARDCQSPKLALSCAPYALLIAAVLLVYANVYRNEFLYDDLFLIVQNSFLQHWSNLLDLLSKTTNSGAGFDNGFYRPLQMLLYFFVYQAFGFSKPAFHAVNVALHAANACLVYRVGCRVGLRQWGSFSAALLWAVHPLHTEAITYISGTADPLCTFFILLGLLVLLPDFASRKFWLAGLYSILALGSKESAIVFPALVTITIFLTSDGRLRPATYLRTWPLWLLAAGFMGGWLTYSAHDFRASFMQDKVYAQIYAQLYAHNLVNRILTCLATLPVYFGLMVWPVNLHMQRNFPVFTSFWYWQVVTGATIAALVMLQIIWGRARRGLALSWGFLWFAAALSPVTSIVFPVNGLIYEHWMYLPTVGIALGTARSLQTWLDRQPKRAIAAATVLVALISAALGAKTFVQNEVWRDIPTFYENTFQHGEQSPRMRNNLGIFYLTQGEFEKAVEQFNIAISHPNIVPHYMLPGLHTGLAFGYLRVRLDQNNLSINGQLNALKQTLPFSSQIPEAIEELNRALELDPDSYQTNEALALIYSQQGDSVKASFYQHKADTLKTLQN